MPTYGYLCKNCNYQFEKLQKFSDDNLKTCPECKQETLIRIISGGAGMVFKGTGFYLTDYGKGGSSPATTARTDEGPIASTKTESSDKGSSEKSSSEKSAAPAASTESKPAAAKKESSTKKSGGTGGGTASKE